MRLYTFEITGGNPFDGEIKVLAKNIKSARKCANSYLAEYNKTNYNQLTFKGKPMSQPVETPMVASFISGEM